MPGGIGSLHRFGQFFYGVAVALIALAALVQAGAPANAQDATTKIGNATISVGGGTALLTLPDVPSLVTFQQSLGTFSFISGSDQFVDFGDEYGWNLNGSIEIPAGAAHSFSVNGFWANIDDNGSATCTQTNVLNRCRITDLVDDPAVAAGISTGNTGGQLVASGDRDADNWGLSIEKKWHMAPGVMGVTRAPKRWTLALGGEIRGIDQDIEVNYRVIDIGGSTATYKEVLDTRYYGVYAAWGSEYSIPFLSGITSGIGIQSSFQLRGGVYFADADYSGRLTGGGGALNSSLSLSDNDLAFIGGLVLETTKRIGRRMALSLKSEYEYYSYVPEMAYNTVDTAPGAVLGNGGGQVGTRLGNDDAFSARTSLRLTIKLGPDSVFEEPLK